MGEPGHDAVQPRLLGPADVRRLAHDLGLRPSKQRGQNFVVDPNTVRRVAAAARLRPDDVVLEVGPGLGSLTLALLPHVARVVAVEVEPALAAALPTTVADRAPTLAARLTVLAADALRVTAADLSASTPDAAPTALVANLPYNVAVPVLLHLLAELPSLQRVLVMVQAEVADRLAAAPGSRVYGAPSVKARWYGEVRRVGAVPRPVFWPVPNVDSGLVALDVRPAPLGTSTEGVDRAEVFAVVDAAFAQRRKTLRAALAPWAGSPAAAEQVLRAAGVDPGLRGEQLDVEAFVAIARAAGHGRSA